MRLAAQVAGGAGRIKVSSWRGRLPTLPEDAIKLARRLAEEAREEDEVRLTTERKATDYPVVPVESHDLNVPMFLHERELIDALRISTLIASGRNPFVSEPLKSLQPEQQVDVLRALAVVVSTLATTHNRTHSEHVEAAGSGSIQSLVDQCDSAAKRPLETYFRRVEKQAILEALADSNYNQTEAARLLGLTYRALRYRIESLGIET